MQAEYFWQLRQIGGVEFDARRVCPRGNGGGSASALVVENELSPGGERRECRPEQLVIEDESTVDADERKRSASRVIS